MDRLEEGIELGEAAYARLGESGDLAARGALAEAVAGTMAHGQHSEGALEWSERALAIAERLDDPDLFAQSLGARSFALFNLGRHQEAVMLARGRAILAEESGSLREQATVKMSLSLYSLPDDTQEMFRVSWECAELARRAGLRVIEETALLNCVETGIGLGKWQEVEAILDAVASRGVQERNELWVRLLRAMWSAWRGDVEAARQQVADALATSGTTEFLAGQTTVLTSRALVHYFSGEMREGLALAVDAVALDPTGINSAAAIAHQARCAIWLKDEEEIRRALEAASLIRGRWLAALRLEVQAALSSLSGNGDNAGDLYTAAVEAWRTLDCLLDVGITELEAVHLLGPGHPQAALAKEAADLFSEFDVPILLERLRSAMGG
jgi:hypothetical protein